MNKLPSDYSLLDRAHHLHSFTHLSQYEEQGSIVIDYGEGIYLYDTDGTRYLDAMSSLWCATLGYSERRLVEAAQKQMSKLPYSHTFRGRSHKNLIELAEKLVEISPPHLSKVYFAGSGSEANESAIKMVWTYHKFKGQTKKRKIISRINGYHGSTIFATRLTGMPPMHDYLNIDFPEIIYADFPNYLSEAKEGESEVEFASRLAQQLEQQIQYEDPETVAAFIAEPVMGVGGVILPPETYFEKVQPILKKYEILFIADEVICAFGRTGDMFGSETFDLKPDILTTAKGVSSAYFPMSAALVTDDIYDVLVKTTRSKGVFSHGFTYSGHPVGAAVALETIAILQERDIPEHVRKVGEYFQSKVQDLVKFPLVGNTRGIGMMAGFDLFADVPAKRKFAREADIGTSLMEIAEKHKLFIRSVGDSVVLAPPLIITESEVDELIECLGRALQELISITEIT